jgi:RNA polymerase sigma factor (sigma-70 family)
MSTVQPATGHPPPMPPEAHQFSARKPNDDELITGSRAEFGILFDRYAGQLYRYCVHRVGPDHAEDMVAETFLIAYQRRQHYDRSRPNAMPWLYGIATNLARRRRGIEARAQQRVAALGTVELYDRRLLGPDHADRVLERVDARAEVKALAGSLAQLSRRHRDILFLLAAGLDQAEVSTALGISPGTVRSRLHRARTQLRKAVANVDVASPPPPILDPWPSPHDAISKENTS